MTQTQSIEHGLRNVSISNIYLGSGSTDENHHEVLTPSKIASQSAQIRLVSSHNEVYEPCDDSFALVDALLADRTNLISLKPTICLEIGSGSGYVITSLAIMLKSGIGGVGTQFFATDINTQAAETTTLTLQSHGVHADIIATDLASGLQKRMEGMVDVIVVNPPYVPTLEDEVGCDGITASWAGGLNGRSVIDRILPIAHKLLSEKGWLYMVTLTANNPMQICRVMGEYGYLSRIVVQRSTEEESLHVIKFWRDSSKGSASTSNEGCSSSSWLSLLSFPSFWKNSRH